MATEGYEKLITDLRKLRLPAMAEILDIDVQKKKLKKDGCQKQGMPLTYREKSV